MADLTDPSYWSARYANVQNWAGDDLEWVEPTVRFLAAYQGQRFLELGCVPGHASAALLRRVSMTPVGVDFADAGDLYTESLRGFSPEFHRADLRHFSPDRPFDVVGSFGLLEHFEDLDEILDHHDRLLRPGGLCIVEVPNFQGVQLLYHRIFDSSDLARHNLAAMELGLYEAFAERAGHDVLFLGHVGRLRFWGVEETAGLPTRAASAAVRALGLAAGRLLRVGSPSLAPWLLYIARKR